MPAFERAVALGYRYIETDVHVTADGVLLAFHDDVLDRVTDRTGTIAELPWPVVREARVDGREPIPLLEDLFGAWPDVRVNIDPKHDEAVAPLVEVIRRAGAVDRVCVGAFDDDRLAVVRDALPGVCTSLGPLAAIQLGMAAEGEDIDELPAPCAQVPTHVDGTESSPTTLRRRRPRPRDSRCTCGRSTTPPRWTRLLDLGVDGIMTDRPAVLKDVLVAWRGPGTGGAPAHAARLPGRARRLFAEPGRRGGRRPTHGPTASSPGAATGWRPRCSATSACGRAIGWRGCAATRTSCSRRTTACSWPGACSCRLNIRLSPRRAAVHPRRQRGVRAVPPPRRRPTPAIRSARSLLGEELRGAAGPPAGVAVGPARGRRARRRPSSSTRAAAPGVPKGAVLSHRALYLHAVHNALTMALTGDDVVLHTIPLFHVNGWGTPHYVTALGGVHVMLPRFDAGRGAAADRGRGRHPPLRGADDDAGDPRLTRPRRRATLSSLVQVSIGGAPAGAGAARRGRGALGCECICGYGMTESSPTLTRSLDKPGEPQVARRRRATTGLPILGVDAPRARRRRRRGAVGRGDRRRDLRPLEPRDDRLLEPARGDRRGAARTAGCTPATWPSSTPTATSRSSTAARTSSSPAARTSRRSRSRRCSTRIRRCSSRRWSACPTNGGARCHARTWPCAPARR